MLVLLLFVGLEFFMLGLIIFFYEPEGGLFCFLSYICLAFFMSLFREIIAYAVSLAGLFMLLMNEHAC